MGTTLSDRASAEVRAHMARQRKTGTELARVLDCSQQSASRRLSGAQKFDLDELAAIADWLGINPVVLLGGSEAVA